MLELFNQIFKRLYIVLLCPFCIPVLFKRLHQYLFKCFILSPLVIHTLKLNLLYTSFQIVRLDVLIKHGPTRSYMQLPLHLAHKYAKRMNLKDQHLDYRSQFTCLEHP